MINNRSETSGLVSETCFTMGDTSKKATILFLMPLPIMAFALSIDPHYNPQKLNATQAHLEPVVQKYQGSLIIQLCAVRLGLDICTEIERTREIGYGRGESKRVEDVQVFLRRPARFSQLPIFYRMSFQFEKKSFADMGSLNISRVIRKELLFCLTRL
jgi:hypothetical protein